MTWNASAQLHIRTCGQCGTIFGMSDTVHQAAMQRKGQMEFFCPNGHARVFVEGETEEQRLRRELARVKQDNAYQADMARIAREGEEAAKRQAAAFKGVATRIKNRVKHGVCPCCNRTFQDLARHMKSQHPDVDNIVALQTAQLPEGDTP